MTSERKTIDGEITKFDHGDRLVLTRASIRALGSGDGDNKHNILDETPTTLDLDLSDGIQLSTGEEFAVFGVVTPIAAETTIDTNHFLYYLVDNRIVKVIYCIRNGDGGIVTEATRDVTLQRQYYNSIPIVWYPSIYEFEHEFQLVLSAGTYTVELTALDQKGNTVTGSEETFTVTYQ